MGKFSFQASEKHIEAEWFHLLVLSSKSLEGDFIFFVPPRVKDVLRVLATYLLLDLLDHAGAIAFGRGSSRLLFVFDPSEDISSSGVLVALEPTDFAWAKPVLDAQRSLASITFGFPIELTYPERDPVGLGHISTFFAVGRVVNGVQTAGGGFESFFFLPVGRIDLIFRDVGK